MWFNNLIKKILGMLKKEKKKKKNCEPGSNLDPKD